MSEEADLKFPTIERIERDNISPLLKGIPRWILWRAGALKGNGKFDKIPTHPVRETNINPHDPKNWMSWEDAIAAYDRHGHDGVGFVMTTEHFVSVKGEKLHLVALDYDDCASAINEVREDWLRLGKPYMEVSPSGKGVRMFALSKDVLRGGNSGHGREMYFKGQFLTVTGRRAKGEIKDATAGINELRERWFAGEQGSEPPIGLGTNIVPLPPPEIEEEVRRVKGALTFISADVDYETWRNIVWAILSTTWSCAEEIALAWSRSIEQLATTTHKFDKAAFDNVVKSFKSEGGVTLGTLFHHAKNGGWTPPARAPELLPVDNSAFMVRPRLLTATEVKALPNTPYLVKGLLPAQGVAAIYGEAGSGKSFLALDLSFAIATGQSDWFGMKVEKRPVSYIALEGRGGIAKRTMAWEKHNGLTLRDEVKFVLQDFSLNDPRDVDALAGEILSTAGSGCLVVIDTLNQSAPGADENASADMSRIIANAKRLGERVRGLVLLVHHAGKDQARGMRGHSSLFAAMDAVIKVTATNGDREWNVTKAKDDDIVASRGFELVPYVVGADDDGDDITSCAVRPMLTLSKPARKPISGKNQMAAMARLHQVMAAGATSISYEDAKTEVAATLTIDPKRRGARAKELLDALIRAGHLSFEGGDLKIA